MEKFTRTLPSKRKQIIEQVKHHAKFLKENSEKLDIYQGNLQPYVDRILKQSLSAEYYNAIKDRQLPINILTRYVNKVSAAYSKPPVRSAKSPSQEEFLRFYEKALDINNSGALADAYSHLFKGFAWEPYINREGRPALRELPYDRFLVISDSMVNPEEETIFVKIVGCHTADPDDTLLFVYTDTEFDAFYMNEREASEYLQDNGGVNVIGTIPFVYGKRQKNKLIPTQDSDMLTIAKSIPVMLTDAAGAQMFQCFTILYGIDVSFENAKMSPNVIWSIKSDKETDKNPQIGSIKPEADTEKVVQFVVNIFVMWLETKGVRVGSVGNIDSGNVISGISKIVDEMDVHKVVSSSMEWFSKDENELWNKKLPKIHNYWLQSGLIDLEKVKDMPAIIPEGEDMEIAVEFSPPTPMISRTEEISNCESELRIGTMTLEQAIRKLHPDYSEEQVDELLSAKETKDAEEKAKFQAELDAKKKNPMLENNNGVDANKNQNSGTPKAKSEGNAG